MEKPQRNLILGGVAVLLLAIAAFVTFGGFGRGGEVPRENVSYCVCLATGEEITVHHRLDEHPPFACGENGPRAAYPWLYCYDCNMRFVPELIRHRDTGEFVYPSHPVCPNCGSTSCGAYVPGLPTQDPVGDCPLPPWPPE